MCRIVAAAVAQSIKAFALHGKGRKGRLRQTLSRQTGLCSESSTVKSSPIGFSVVNPSLFRVNSLVEDLITHLTFENSH